jgi:hypothetical protein
MGIGSRQLAIEHPDVGRWRDARQLSRERPVRVGRGNGPVSGQRHLADRAHERRVLDARDARHACEAGVRRKVRVGVHLEDPRPTGTVDPHVDAPVALPADETPRREGDPTDLGRDLDWQVGRAAGDPTEILVAALLPLRAIAHDPPHTARHLAEVDLRDWEGRIAKNSPRHGKPGAVEERVGDRFP